MKRNTIIFTFMLAILASVTSGCYVGYAQRHDRDRHEGHDGHEDHEHRDH